MSATSSSSCSTRSFRSPSTSSSSECWPCRRGAGRGDRARPGHACFASALSFLRPVWPWGNVLRRERQRALALQARGRQPCVSQTSLPLVYAAPGGGRRGGAQHRALPWECRRLAPPVLCGCRPLGLGAVAGSGGPVRGLPCDVRLLSAARPLLLPCCPFGSPQLGAAPRPPSARRPSAPPIGSTSRTQHLPGAPAVGRPPSHHRSTTQAPLCHAAPAGPPAAAVVPPPAVPPLPTPAPATAPAQGRAGGSSARTQRPTLHLLLACQPQRVCTARDGVRRRHGERIQRPTTPRLSCQPPAARPCHGDGP